MATPTGLTLRIDVSERLRRLPWELLCWEGAFLCGSDQRPLTPCTMSLAHMRAPSPVTTVPCASSSWLVLQKIFTQSSTSSARSE